jgi:hypothetical protein
MEFLKSMEIPKRDLFRKRNIKILGLLGFTSIFIVNFIVSLYPARGYESSIYENTPSIAWFLLLFVALSSTLIIIYEVYRENYTSSNAWIYGLILIILYRISVLCMSFNRGYLGYHGDHTSHIGTVSDIIMYGFIDPNNYYPITHIYLTVISLIGNIPVDIIVSYSTPIFSLFFVLSVFLIMGYIIPNRGVALLTLVAAGCVLFPYDLFLMPNGWSIIFFPFAMYLIIRSMDNNSNQQYKLLAIIIIMLYPFFHILSSLILGLVLVMLFAIYILSKKLLHGHKCTLKSIIPAYTNSPLLLIISLFTVIFFWIFSFRAFENNISILFEAILYGSDADVIAELTTKTQKLNLDFIGIINSIVKIEGVTLIFFVLFLFGSYLVCRYYFNEAIFRKVSVFIFTVIFLSFFYAGYLFNIIPGLESIAGQRILLYIKYLTPLFAGIVYMHLLLKKNRFILILCIGLIMTPIILSMYTAMPSPYISRPNLQTTTMDVSGMEWSFLHKDTKDPYAFIMSRPFRFAHAVLGRYEVDKRSDIRKWGEKQMSDHFNYTHNDYLGNSDFANCYLVILKFDRILYSTVWKEVGRFNDGDFARLNNDYSVQYLYSNGECDIYYIRDSTSI